MTANWYPSQVNVGPEGTRATYRFLEATYPSDAHFTYAEFGIYRADTARHICEMFPNSTLHLFDFHENVRAAKDVLGKFSNRIFFYGNTQKYNDSYNWELIKLIEKNASRPIFDYCFLDGAHTVAVDALNFFLCDRLLRPGGYMDFDDYGWRLRNSSLDPQKIPAIADQYTDEQIDAFQVRMIVDTLVKRDSRYEQVKENKVFRKVR